MATIVLAAAGGAVGAGFGGSILGLSGAVIGRAVGAVVGHWVDQRLLGQGSEAVETGRVQRFALTGASEGATIPWMAGSARIGGQVIWATRFREEVTRSGGGGKGAPQPVVVSYSYSVSLAIALCEGEITRVGRIWADGIEIARDQLNLRVYTGSQDQQPDPKIEAVEGAGLAPAYRGTAYVVIEDLALGPFGNRVPQFSFEVMRVAQGALAESLPDLTHGLRGVALIPGTGEYALATTPVHYNRGPGVNVAANAHASTGRTDMLAALQALDEELPACRSVSLVVSWFGNDLRCGACELRPLVEQKEAEGAGMVWRAGGIGRAEAGLVPQVEGRPVYGGTPADAAVVEAIRAIRAKGQEVMFYPFVLMDQMAGNGRPDPWTGAADQPALPWRGRITLSVAPGREGSPDRSAAAETEVAAFFGAAQPQDFTIAGGEVQYHGAADWGYRRFILHYAHLAALAGGVDAFCLGSELRGLTQARGAGDSFPAVAQYRALLADLRAILGPDVALGYAADWSEYGAYQSPEGGLYFPLDPLWADETLTFVGIDNYMPLSDWREGEDHADAGWGAIYDLDYLQANIAGGEGYEWYYDSAEGRDAQRRRPIEDGAYGEPWVYRVKDLRNWWGQPHVERPGGIRAAAPTPWLPESKPIRFTEMGCPAIDKGTNEPNKFVDPKSSESAMPHYSRGTRDDLIQLQYLRAMIGYWGKAENNPSSTLYGGAMVDMDHAHVWAWDSRPFPAFPSLTDVWADGANYRLGHWLNGRAAGLPLATVVAEICERSGVTAIDASRLYGYLRGFVPGDAASAREALQPLMLAYGFDAVEREGVLQFRMRNAAGRVAITADDLADPGGGEAVQIAERSAEAESAGQLRLSYIEAEGDYAARTAEARFPGEAVHSVAESDLPLVLTAAEGRAISERWLAEARVARDVLRFALPPSHLALGAGDGVELSGRGMFRIDRVEKGALQAIEAVRVETAIYQPSDSVEEPGSASAYLAPLPVYPLFLDLPLMRGTEDPVAPHLAVTATPWPGTVAVYDADEDAGYGLNRLIERRAVLGVTQGPLLTAAPGRWDRGAPLRVKVYGGALQSAEAARVLGGANLAAIGDGSADRWELLQFAQAELVGENLYDLSLRLRGQAGTEGVMPELWPAGSLLVLLDGAVEQIAYAPQLRDLARHYRVGPAGRSYDDASYVHLIEAFAGIGLRPYAPCHLRAEPGASGDFTLSWIRRTRIDGDSWQGMDVPLGEAQEAYLLRVRIGGEIRREVTLAAPGWTYDAAMQQADGALGPFRIELAQLSDRFGAGLFTGMDLYG